MSQLSLNPPPGFVDVPDAQLAAEQYVTDDSLVKVSQNAKFSAIRWERIYMGFYKHGDTVPKPSSPVDGYTYSYKEMLFDVELYSTRPPLKGFKPGQAAAPAIAGYQPANLYWFTVDANDRTGQVEINMSYYREGGTETITHDGIVKIFANCQRQSVNISNVRPEEEEE